MTGSAKKVLDDALALPPDECSELADALARSVKGDVEISPEWRAELARRLEELAKGDVELVSWSVVQARLARR